MIRCILLSALVLPGVVRAAACPVIPKPNLIEERTGTCLAPGNVVKVEDASVPAEGYDLTVATNGVRIAASSPAGFFYASQTLEQLRFASDSLPCVRIADAPRFRWRALLLDCSRHFVGVDEVKRFIDLMARYKFNVFHWHLVDSHGWRMQVPKYPQLVETGAWRDQPGFPGGRYGGYYTTAQMEDVVRYAAERFVTVVPEIEIPGHAAAAIAACPFLACDGVTNALAVANFATYPPRNFKNHASVHPRYIRGMAEGCETVCVGKESTFRFYEDVLDEVMRIFPSEYIHIGGDEVRLDNWRGCASCRKRLSEIGGGDLRKLMPYAATRLMGYLKEHGRKAIGWDDVLDGGVPEGTAIQCWRGGDEDLRAAKAGARVVLSPVSFAYLCLSQSAGLREPDCHRGFLPLETAYAHEPVSKALRDAGLEDRVLGVEGCLWTEYTHTRSVRDTQTWPRACAIAEAAWSRADSRDLGDFLLRVERTKSYLASLEVDYFDETKDYSAWDHRPDDDLFFRGRPADGQVRPLETAATVQHPQTAFTNAAGRVVLDFGQDAFGWLEIDAPGPGLRYFAGLGERLKDDGTVDRRPGGSVRAIGVRWKTEGRGFRRVPLPPDLRNTFAAEEGAAIEIPERFGTIAPFRAVEFYQGDFPLTTGNVRRVVVSYPAKENDSAFACDDPRLERVWDFCKRSLFATSFAGLFVDGDRERIPYEADAFASQLSWYAVSADSAYPRASIEYLYRHPTWPTEFRQCSVSSAWADWMWTGDRSSAAFHYDLLKGRLMLERTRKDGLLVSGGERLGWQSYTNRLGLADIVDWPMSERDGFDFRDVNAVVNAFHYRNLREMSDIASVIGRTDDAVLFAERASCVRKAYGDAFLDPVSGLCVDGEGSRHSSLHANAVAVAFGLVPPERIGRIADWLEGRGMACSVYFSMYLLEALYRAGREDAAFRLLTADDDRSWIGMMKAGATITTEAWNMEVKPNQDWNHSWGAVAANVISRFVVGVTPSEPGFSRVRIAPQPGPLQRLSATVPTDRGKICVDFRFSGSSAEGTVNLPYGTSGTFVWKGAERELRGGINYVRD